MGGIQKWAWYLGGAQSATVALPHFVFDFVVVDVAQFQLTVSEQDTKIIVILLSVVVNCIHFIAVAMLKISWIHQPIRSECYSPRPFGLLSSIDSMASESNYYFAHVQTVCTRCSFSSASSTPGNKAN